MSENKIRNLNDILNVVNENNVENFLEGFGSALRSHVKLIGNIRHEYEKAEIDLSSMKNSDILRYKYLTYIDDGKQDNIIIIHLP